VLAPKENGQHPPIALSEFGYSNQNKKQNKQQKASISPPEREGGYIFERHGGSRMGIAERQRGNDVWWED
jgi:hypothetical protein